MVDMAVVHCGGVGAVVVVVKVVVGWWLLLLLGNSLG